MQRDERDPQVELVRRYARILRSAPAEAMRAWSPSTPTRPSGVVVTPGRFARETPTRPEARAAAPRA
jgi:hypothetical protein